MKKLKFVIPIAVALGLMVSNVQGLSSSYVSIPRPMIQTGRGAGIPQSDISVKKNNVAGAFSTGSTTTLVFRNGNTEAVNWSDNVVASYIPGLVAVTVCNLGYPYPIYSSGRINPLYVDSLQPSQSNSGCTTVKIDDFTVDVLGSVDSLSLTLP